MPPKRRITDFFGTRVVGDGSNEEVASFEFNEAVKLWKEKKERRLFKH